VVEDRLLNADSSSSSAVDATTSSQETSKLTGVEETNTVRGFRCLGKIRKFVLSCRS
jgi:hypothetical protein